MGCIWMFTICVFQGALGQRGPEGPPGKPGEDVSQPLTTAAVLYPSESERQPQPLLH